MNNNNVLFIGPPGCGKTYEAKKFVVETFFRDEKDLFKACFPQSGSIKSILKNPGINDAFSKLKENYNEQIKLVSLHSGFTYSDMVEGIVIDEQLGSSVFVKQDKMLKKMAKYSAQHDKSCFLILDDIDRVDIQSVLGEFSFALDNRNEEITGIFGEKIVLPSKLYIIATMSNTSFDKAVNYSFISKFKCIILNSSKNDLKKQINSLCEKRIPKIHTSASIEKQKKSIFNLYEKYQQTINENVTYEFSDKIERYQIGFSYFLPPKDFEIEDLEKICKIKALHQVHTLMKQYAKDGVIEEKNIPPAAWNYTVFTRNREEVLEPHIKIEYFDETDSYNHETMEYYRKLLFDGNQYVSEDDLGCGKIGNGKINYAYLFLFSLVKDICENNLVNDYALIEMMKSDYNIIKSEGPGGVYGGLINDKDKNFHIIDDKTGKNQNQYHYNYHTFVYGKKEYLMEGKLRRSETKIEKNPDIDINNCFASGSQKQGHGDEFRIAKVFVYKYFKLFEQLLLEFIESDECNSELEEKKANDDLEMVQKDLAKIEGINFTNEGTDGYIDSDRMLFKQGVATNREYCFIRYIRQLDTWEKMRNGELKGVYKKMDTNYWDIMKSTGVKQMILQGPPGTSKTYGVKMLIAERIGLITEDNKKTISDKYINDRLEAHKLIYNQDKDEYVLPSIEDGEKKVYWDMIQFHPSYTYEDFVRGISIKSSGGSKKRGNIYSSDNDEHRFKFEFDGGMEYRVVNKTFGRICKIADSIKEDDAVFILVIDEINRANLAAVFGELIYALEYRGEKVATPYKPAGEDSTELVVPENVYLLGTMNTADKSIGGIDYAIRRRFLFFPMLPDAKVIVSSLGDAEGKEGAEELKLFFLMQKIFDECINEPDFEKEDVHIGHTYFIKQEGKNAMQNRFNTQICPILNEYLKDGVIKKDELKKIYEGKVLDYLKGGKEYKELLDIIGEDEKYTECVKKWLG